MKLWPTKSLVSCFFDSRCIHGVTQVCFNLADDLRNMKGKGARLFAKRQAKSESWTVSADDDDTTDAQTSGGVPESSSSIQQKLSAQHRPATDQQVPADERPGANRLHDTMQVRLREDLFHFFTGGR